MAAIRSQNVSCDHVSKRPATSRQRASVPYSEEDKSLRLGKPYLSPRLKGLPRNILICGDGLIYVSYIVPYVPVRNKKGSDLLKGVSREEQVERRNNICILKWFVKSRSV